MKYKTPYLFLQIRCKFVIILIFLSSYLTLQANEFRIIGYLPAYRWNNIPTLDFKKVTHVNLSFANPDASGNLGFAQDISDVITRAHNANTKVFMAIGGGRPGTTAFENYTKLLLPENRSSFIQKIVNYVLTNNLDGIDIDFENDFLLIPYFNEFALELTTALHLIGKEVTAAVTKSTGNRFNNQTLNALDWINLMCYDATGPWTPNNPGQHAPMSKVIDEFAYWKETRMVDKHKINIGVPFYGYEFVNSTTVNALTYNTIVNLYPNAEFTDIANGNIFYNGIPTIILKTEFAFKNAKGIMFWEWGQDSNNEHKSLLNAINNTIKDLSTREKTITQFTKILYNQSTKKIQLKLDNSTKHTISIYSISGMKMFTAFFSSSIEIDIEKWAKGIYILTYHDGDVENNLKISLI
jgi:hypothetical protein